jgi:hypothetical protein
MPFEPLPGARQEPVKEDIMTHSRREVLRVLGTAAGAVAVADLSDGLIGLIQRIEAAPRAAHLLERSAVDDPSMALSRLLTQLTDSDPRIRAAAVKEFAGSEDVGAVEAIGRILVDADRREAVDYALAWIVSEQ